MRVTTLVETGKETAFISRKLISLSKAGRGNTGRVSHEISHAAESATSTKCAIEDQCAWTPDLPNSRNSKTPLATSQTRSINFISFKEL